MAVAANFLHSSGSVSMRQGWSFRFLRLGLGLGVRLGLGSLWRRRGHKRTVGPWVIGIDLRLRAIVIVILRRPSFRFGIALVSSIVQLQLSRKPWVGHLRLAVPS